MMRVPSLILFAGWYASTCAAGPHEALPQRFRCTGADGSTTYDSKPCAASETCLAWDGHAWSQEFCKELRKPLGFIGDPDDRCRQNATCWSGRRNDEGFYECQRAAEAQARYQFRWEDGWLEAKIKLIGWANYEQGTLLYGSDKLSFQNGFGAWQRVEVACVYNPTSLKTDAGVTPKR